ncbi:uncharacterized protein [Montipora capricornis]|uniref:uncharacterized protein isoform X2 n=1 Tax=Montipora capricornis TaxID=246305 RepID=UPI0035F18B60
MSRTARVTFKYVAEQDDELSLEVGAIIRNIKDVDTGWCQGELNGKTGLFPDTFVEEVDITPDVDPASDSVAGKEAKVTFDYEAHDQDELTLKLGDIVHVLGEDEQGWWRGQLGGKRGVFPSNFVEIITDNNVAKPKDTPLDPARKLSGETSPLEKKTTRNEVVDGLHVNDDEESGIKRSSNFGAAAKKLPGGGMGFGNLINPNILAEKKLKKVHQDEKRENKGKTEEAFVPTTEPSKPSLVKTKTPVSSKERSAPPVALASPDESDSDATPEHTVSPVRPDKRPAHFATKEQPPSKNAVPSQPIKVVWPTPGKKPVAPQKPSLPSKKPLPLKSKKPDVAAEKPEKKVVDSEEIAGAKKGGDEAELKDEVRIKPTPDIKSENVDEVSRTDTNFERQRDLLQHKGGMVACLVEQLQKKELQQEIGRTQLQEKEEQTREKENGKANLQRQLEVLQQQLREKEQCLDNYQAQLEERNLRETNLIQQLQEKELQRENCQRQLQEMEERIREKEDNKANSRRQLREMAQSFEERMGEKEEEKTNLETQLRMKNQHKGGMVACLVEQLQKKELQQEIGRTQLQEKEEQTREKENDKANLQGQLEVLQQQLREKEQCLDNYQAQLEERNLRETNLIQQLQEKELQRENCQRQLQEMEEQIREKEDNKANSRRQLREMAQSFEERMGEKEGEKTNLETQLRMKNQQLSELETSLSAAQQMIIELRQESCDWVISRDEIQVKDKSLGKGGWGSVNEATYCGCKVAVKQIHELILSPHNRRLFEREMYIASRCRHPCLLQFIGATNDEGSPLFVTELMELSLRALLEQRQLTETQISVISLDISRALNYLHHMKPPIVHRDVSSANVLLWRRGEQWRGKVSDYGTAKFVQQNMTVAPGALIYSAPEAVSSNQTSKVDVYSFGVLLCEMYIREMPDPERREEQVLLVRNRFFRNLVRQCLQADPATRPDMAQIIQQLEQFDGTDDRLN